jgi:hypothetical protein
VLLKQPESYSLFAPVAYQASWFVLVVDRYPVPDFAHDQGFGFIKEFLQMVSPNETSSWLQEVPEW